MHRLWIAAAVAAAFAVGRASAPSTVEARPATPAARTAQLPLAPPVITHCPALPPALADGEDDDEDAADAVAVEDTEAVRLLADESRRLARLEASLGPYDGALRGQVREMSTGEALPGVTVVVELASGSQAAISDDEGWYELGALPPGTYTVTFYYADTRVEYEQITVRARHVTPLYAQIMQVHINVIGVDRHFEDFEDLADSDDEGVSFSSGTTIENEYVVE